MSDRYRLILKRKWMVRVLTLLAAYHLSPITSFAQTPHEWRDSVSVLLEQIRQDPKNTDLRLRKAEANIQLQQWDYAIEEYGNVLRIDPRNLAALYFRAYCLSHERRYDQAKADYDAFLAIEPLHLEARLGLAHVLQKMGRKSDTIDELNHIVQMFPDSADAHAARAAYETELQHYDIALYDWDQAIRLRPGNLSLLVSKVDVLLRMGRRREAREILDTAVASGTPRSQLHDWYERCK